MAHMPSIPAYQPLQGKAYFELKKMIENHSLSSDVIYSETKISKELGISRTPIRSALHRLVQEGYIEIIPSKGFRLHEIQKTEINEAIQMLCAIESYCAIQLSAGLQLERSKVIHEKLLIVNKQMQHLIKVSNSIEEIISLNNEFHNVIVKALGNQGMIDTFSLYLHRMSNNIQNFFERGDGIKQVTNEHEKILKAIESGNIDSIYTSVAHYMYKVAGSI